MNTAGTRLRFALLNKALGVLGKGSQGDEEALLEQGPGVAEQELYMRTRTSVNTYHAEVEGTDHAHCRGMSHSIC